MEDWRLDKNAKQPIPGWHKPLRIGTWISTIVAGYYLTFHHPFDYKYRTVLDDVRDWHTKTWRSFWGLPPLPPREGPPLYVAPPRRRSSHRFPPGSEAEKRQLDMSIYPILNNPPTPPTPPAPPAPAAPAAPAAPPTPSTPAAPSTPAS
eukprot:TRINITY_DN2048_c1_g1_i1.p1 TRINITY_DN2048_c1_g1~~TRINITY_DN2048_c1_g1_i1.p1  ORF type:complete len:149 (+),score=35.13 TRINITY_DN2048_c1_g1_i1:23-469(+)